MHRNARRLDRKGGNHNKYICMQVQAAAVRPGRSNLSSLLGAASMHVSTDESHEEDGKTNKGV